MDASTRRSKTEPPVIMTFREQTEKGVTSKKALRQCSQLGRREKEKHRTVETGREEDFKKEGVVNCARYYWELE